MVKYEPQVAIAVVGVAGFQLLQAWNANAPSLSEIRSADPGNVSVRQKLMDADFMVGGLAVVLGVTFALLTRDLTALIVMLVMFGTVSAWHHAVMNAEAR